jgi:hypothetical protein
MTIVYLPARAASLPGRIAYGALAILVLVLGFFFLAAAVVAGTVLAGGVLIRYWWVKRRLRKAADSEFITTQYSVVEREDAAGPAHPGDRR